MVEMDESDALIRQNIRSILASRRMAQAELARRAGLPKYSLSDTYRETASVIPHSTEDCGCA
jgi:transcriptional regulator with XRE-family HTH domain